MLLYRIRDLNTSRALWQRFFIVWTVTVISSDKSLPTLVLKNIKHPLHVTELIHTQAEEMILILNRMA